MKTLVPMLSKTGTMQDLVKKGYIYEPKLDGIRVLCYKTEKGIELINRNKSDITHKYPELDFEPNINAKTCILDGELVAYDDKGNPDFHKLMRRDQLSNAFAIEALSKEIQVAYVVFDILMKDGKDLTSLPLAQRKKILEKTVKNATQIEKIFYTANGMKIWDFIMARNLEGVMAKDTSTPYSADRRTDYWVKVKNFKSQDCIIAGFSQEIRIVSSLALAAYYKGNLRFCGKVGTGFTEPFLIGLYAELAATIISKPSFPFPDHYKGIKWVKPLLTCEIKYLEFGSDGMLRSPVFMRMRPDKTPEQCLIELPERISRKEKTLNHKARQIVK